MTRRVSADLGRFTENEAAELMVHHLRLAAVFFEMVPESLDECFNHLERIINEQEWSTPAAESGRAWLKRIHAEYKELDE